MPVKTPQTRLRSFGGRRSPTGVARYYQLYELLSNALNDGTIAPGSALPSEPTLVSRHHVSRTTVRRALERLERENRIVRLRGSGTFARQTSAAKKLCLNLHAFFDDIPAIASKTSVSLVRFKSDALPVLARELQAQVGEPAHVIQRLRKHNAVPYQLSTTYVSESVARSLSPKDLRSDSILTLLDRIGPKMVKVEHSMSAIAADATAARELQVPLGTPLLRMRAVLSDARGKIRALFEGLSRPDQFKVRAELERDGGSKSQVLWRLKRNSVSRRKRSL
jgi:GntR family transcriptional regulator